MSERHKSVEDLWRAINATSGYCHELDQLARIEAALRVAFQEAGHAVIAEFCHPRHRDRPLDMRKVIARFLGELEPGKP